jgi:succinyl-diaminopimelate desuccinylase
LASFFVADLKENSMSDSDRLIERYFEMIKINSVYGNEHALAGFISEELSSLGLVAESYLFEGRKESPSLVARIPGKNPGKKVLLIGHMDTVDIASGWKTDPFVPHEDGDLVYGLGAMDMKGGLSAILETAEYFNRNRDFCGEIILAFASDEEFLSRGTHTLICADVLDADMAIMAECRFDNAAVGFRGRYSFIVKVAGKTAHASKYPQEGESAIINASKLALEIEKLGTLCHQKLGKGTWCIRNIEGGIRNTLSVPDACELFVDRYVVPGENAETCTEQIMQAAAGLHLDQKISVSLSKRSTPYMESFEIDPDHPIVTALSRQYKKVAGENLSLAYDKSVCDSNYLSAIGKIPTITFGPSGGNMHGANEYGFKSQVIMAAQIYRETLKEILC